MPSNTPTLLRTPATWTRYTERRATLKEGECFMCRLNHITVIHEFKHWVIVTNQYPYDAVAEVHHLLIPRNHTAEEADLNLDERKEFNEEVKEYVEEHYDFLGFNTKRNQTQKQHLHMHLLVWKRK